MAEGTQKKKRFRNAFGARFAFNIARRQYDMTKGMVDDVKPKERLTKRSFMSGDADGGVARFRRLSAHLDHDELLERIFGFERARSIYLVSAVAAILLIPLTAVYGYTAWFFVIGLVLAVVFCFVKAMQADFCAWRLRQGRMAPLVDYLNNRLPHNMQIMED